MKRNGLIHLYSYTVASVVGWLVDSIDRYWPVNQSKQSKYSNKTINYSFMYLETMLLTIRSGNILVASLARSS